ncbi:Uncharacterised protein [Mycobacteroides abscessus subsp. massiliense]|nr:Uncharacterised protein [Mycobacteroides abscessus subsp. massiliense]
MPQLGGRTRACTQQLVMVGQYRTFYRHDLCVDELSDSGDQFGGAGRWGEVHLSDARGAGPARNRLRGMSKSRVSLLVLSVVTVCSSPNSVCRSFLRRRSPNSR